MSFDFLFNVFSETFLFLRIERDTITHIYGFSCKLPVILQVLMKLEFFRQNFENYSNMKFHENPTSETRVIQCGQMDGQTEMTKLIVALRISANAPKYVSKWVN
jgi:hypothetical protein